MNSELERLDQLIMIESMVRDGYSEREIADALRRRHEWDQHFRTQVALPRWIRAMLGR